MNRFSMWFSDFMRGRYGMDSFNRFLLIVAFVLIVTDWILRWRILDILTLVILIYTYCRIFSRNIYARQQENQRFLQLSSRYGKGSGRAGRTGSFSVAKDKDHKILRCPGCGEKLRVPKGAGNIMISCPHCHTKFNKKV